jgi:hypothetical protein
MSMYKAKLYEMFKFSLEKYPPSGYLVLSITIYISSNILKN